MDANNLQQAFQVQQLQQPSVEAGPDLDALLQAFGGRLDREALLSICSLLIRQDEANRRRSVEQAQLVQLVLASVGVAAGPAQQPQGPNLRDLLVQAAANVAPPQPQVPDHQVLQGNAKVARNLDDAPPGVSSRGIKKSLVTSRTSGPEPFPERLFRMLLAEEGRNDDIISFSASGRSFWIHDRDRLIAEIVPKYFRQKKWGSFSRQMNIYGFTRLNTGPESGAFWHPHFRRDRPELLSQMPRNL